MLRSCMRATPLISCLNTLRQFLMGRRYSLIFLSAWVRGTPVHSSITKCTCENSSITSYSLIIDGCLRSLRLSISLWTELATSSLDRFFLLYDFSASWALVVLCVTRQTIPKAPAPICMPISKSLSVNACSSGFRSLFWWRMFLNFFTKSSFVVEACLKAAALLLDRFLVGIGTTFVSSWF